MRQCTDSPSQLLCFVSACLFLVACGEGDGGDAAAKVVIEGAVQGSSLGEEPPGLAVLRLANTQLSPDGERLTLYFGEDFLSFCPDIGEPFEAATTLIFSLQSESIAPGIYPYCDDECDGNSLEAKFDGWLLPSGETVRPIGGEAELRTFNDTRVEGSFRLEFPDSVVTGDFQLDLACIDDRPRE
jgi:hypothetical protein